MKLISTFTFLFVLQSGFTNAQGVGVYRVPRDARAELNELAVTVRHGKLDEAYTVELTVDDVEQLRASGVSPTLLHSSLAAEALANNSQEAVPAGFTSYVQMRTEFYNYAAAFPSIAKLEVLGLSVNGREIFALRISGNVLVEEDEPELVFCGNIHGDEYASGEMPYRYAKHLCDNYGIDPDVTNFVDNNEIWLIPLINPDGHENGTRRNVNNVDLNRDFGFQWNGEGGSPAENSQPETQAIFSFWQSSNITLSSTIHCSGDVLFYPWGFSANGTTDSAIIQSVGAAYSTAASYNLVNSWSDYETHGELLDTAYGAFGGLCFTTEISNVSGALNFTYDRNKAGMDVFCGSTLEGLHGLVTDANTGLPLRAMVMVSGSEVPCYSDSVVGDVHRIVMPGTYSVTVWANGYEPQTVTGINVVPGTRGEFQVALNPGGNEHAFSITANNQADPFNSYANVSSPTSALGAPDGVACSLGLNGFIVLDLGENHAIVDGPGVDFTVTEALIPGDMVNERYRVYGSSNAFSQTTLIGMGGGTWSYDLNGSGLSSVRYIRIEDGSTALPNDPLAGVELDSITVLNSAAGSSLLASAAQISLSGGGIQTFSLDAPTPDALYFLLTTFTGTTPGTVFSPSYLSLPLNSSSLFLSTATRPNKLVKKGLAFLNASGEKTATMTIPAGQDPTLNGLVLQHAYMLLDLITLTPSFISNAVTTSFIP
ncbi:MAG: hypothetical protein ACI8TQ_001245 [Planctomycetota bacterium]|jgi:hypothetical protein